MVKTCGECSTEKALHEFYPKKRAITQYSDSKAGVSSACKECVKASKSIYVRNNPDKVKEQDRRWKANNPDKVRDWDLKRKYGIDLTTYRAMFEAQNHCCASCKKHQSEFDRVFAVDHNHITGQVRGLLCIPCNVALGMLEEKQESIQNLLNYINFYSELAASNTNVVKFSPKKVG